MKTIRKFAPLPWLAGLSLLILLGLTSCEDDNVIVVIDPDLSELDAQELMAVILSYDTYGLVAQFDQIGKAVEDLSECGETTENTETETGGYNRYDYEYTYTEIYTLNCEPERSVIYDLSGRQDIDALNYDAVHDILTAFTTTGLEESSADEIHNGTYGRGGSWQSDNSDAGYDFEYDSTLFDVRVSKETHQIQSGTGTFTLIQNYKGSGEQYTYTGTIVFLNAAQAEVTFEDGESFIVDLGNVSIAE